MVFLYLRSFKSKSDANEYLNIAQRIDNLSTSFNQSLRETIQMVSSELRKQRDSVERSSLAVHQQVQDFTKGITSLDENLKQVHDSVKTVSSFQKLFQSPKLRGRWGETSLEAVLAQFYPKDLYNLQYSFESGEVVDAVLKLPDSKLLPIDAKFPLENFEKMVEAEDDTSRDLFKKAFLADIKKEVDSISSKYILPSEGTVDMALMYIPAESIYYEVINSIKEVDISSYARAKRLILVSPNTFYLTLSAIQHWFKDVQITKETKEIIKKMGRISVDGRKLGDEFRKLGKHLSDAKGSYDGSEKRLGLMLNRVENVMEMEEGEKDHTETPSEPVSSTSNPKEEAEEVKILDEEKIAQPHQ